MKNLNELIKELPDYVMGRIKDENLIRDIQYQLKNNRDFEIEYNRIKDIVAALNVSQPLDVPENYFVNLSADINRKIDDTAIRSAGSPLYRFLFNKKFAVWSAVAAVIVFVALMAKPVSDFLFRNENPTVPQITARNDSQNRNPVLTTNGLELYLDEIEEIQGDFSSADDEINVVNSQNKKTAVKKFKPKLYTGKTTVNDNELLDLFLYDYDEDNNLPNEELFLKLPSDEQKNIIKEIKNLKI
jgi:hypothetical protein